MSAKTYEAHPAAQLFPLLQGEAALALRADIQEHGLRVPIVLYEGKILDGRNRYEACRLAGVKPAFCEWSGMDEKGNPIDPAKWVLSINLHRRHLNESQRAMVGARWLDYQKAQAKEREHARKTGTVENLPPSSQGKSRDKAGAAVKVSGKSVEAAARVLKSASPEVVRAVEEGRVAVSDAAKSLKSDRQVEALELVESGRARTLVEATKALAKRANVEAINSEPEPLPEGPFRVIAVDPPWRYDSRVDDGTHRGRNPYADMSTEEICAMPIASRAHADCVLWLWTTNAFMADAYRCLDAWGFEAKTILTWDKQKLGLGDWLRNVTEHCILATRGRPTVTLKAQTTLISESRREHSRKPEAFYELVESLCPGGKLEVFGRAQRKGWTVWGAQADYFEVAL